MSWKFSPLNELCYEDKTIVESNSCVLPYLGLEMVESQTGVIDWTANTNAGVSNCYAFDSRHVLYGKLRPYLNKVALPESSGRCSTEIIPLLPNKSVDRKYLAYLLRRKETIEFVTPENTGSRMPRADMKHLMKMRVPFPPIDEQKRIAAEIERKLAAVARARKAAEEQLEVARSLRQTTLNTVFANTQYPLVNLGFLGEVYMCKRIFKEQTIKNGEIPFYKIGTLGREADAYIPETLYQQFKSKYPFPKKGQILISCSGTIGKTVMYNGEPAYYQDSNIVWLDHDEKKVTSEYLQFCYSLNPWNPTDGTTIARLYADGVREAKILLPPINEQKRVATLLQTKLAKVDLLISNIQQQIKTITALPAAILREAFGGQE